MVRNCEPPSTFVTFVRFFAGVNSHVRGDVAGIRESLVACFAFICSLSSMRPLVCVQPSQFREAFLTLAALVRFVTAMRPLMVRQGSQVCETLRAFVAYLRMAYRLYGFAYA